MDRPESLWRIASMIGKHMRLPAVRAGSAPFMLHIASDVMVRRMCGVRSVRVGTECVYQVSPLSMMLMSPGFPSYLVHSQARIHSAGSRAVRQR